MKIRKIAGLKLAAACVAPVVLTLGLTACTPADQSTEGESTSPAPGVESSETTAPPEPTDLEGTQGALQPQKIWEREHQLRNGDTITCLYVQDSGLSCDWGGAVEYGGQK